MSETGMVKINDLEMEYAKFGSGDKVFVILPGLSIKSVIPSVDAVDDAYGILNEEFTSYLFDRRKTVPEGYSIYDMADDTAAVMKELGLSDTYVFGASQGGMIAMAMAIRYPELVKKLVLGSTSPHVKPHQRAVLDRWIELARKKDAEGLCVEYAKEIYPKEVFEQYKGVFLDMAKTVTDEELEKFIIVASSIIDFDVSGELKKIKCPTLALGVLDSDATMEIAENLDYRPDFSLYMYTGYGHAAFDTAPDYKQRVFDFLMEK